MNRIEQELFDLEEHLRRNDDIADNSAYLTIIGIANKVSELDAENAKLRELVRRYGEYTSQDHCEGCFCKSSCNDGDVDECWQLTEMRRMARELEVGVD